MGVILKAFSTNNSNAVTHGPPFEDLTGMIPYSSLQHITSTNRADVHVTTFDGMRVAVKTLKTVIINEKGNNGRLVTRLKVMYNLVV